MRSGNSDPTGALLLGMGGGVLMFYRGFKRFREYKIVADTPRVPIRSMPMGLVHIRGTAQSEQLVQSPLTHTPCCFYQVVVERWKTEDRSGHWEHHCTDRDGIKFYLQDETGRVQIDSYSAEYDLPESAVRVVDGSNAGANSSMAVPDLALLQYVEMAGGRSFLQKAQHWMAGKDTHGDPQKEQARQQLLTLMEGGLAFARDRKMPVELIERAVTARGPLADPQHEQARQMFLERLKGGEIQMPQLGQSAASGRYRLHEHLILPGQTYFVEGTCAENPSPTSEHDRNLIQQGRNEKTFLISAKSEQVAQKDMRNSAFKMVLGGVALTLGCLAFLLLHWKMF